MVYAEKLASEEKSDNPFWELTKPVPLNDDGSSVEEALGQNPDVHYIYICTKVTTFMALRLVTCCMPLVNSTCHIPLFWSTKLHDLKFTLLSEVECSFVHSLPVWTNHFCYNASARKFLLTHTNAWLGLFREGGMHFHSLQIYVTVVDPGTFNVNS